MDDHWETGRMEAFSDGVFAIAITLLVLEINVPESAFENLWSGIANQWPSYLAYVTSFLTIGGIWGAHHGIFRRLQFANKRLMVINLLLLMAVAFLPFPTKLMAEAIHTQDAARAAAIFYGAALLVISLLLGALWGCGRARPLRPAAGGGRGRDQGDHPGDHASHRLLRGHDRARGLRTASRDLRVPRDRDRRAAAGAWRPAEAGDDAFLTTGEADRGLSSQSMLNEDATRISLG